MDTEKQNICVFLHYVYRYLKTEFYNNFRKNFEEKKNIISPIFVEYIYNIFKHVFKMCPFLVHTTL